MSNLLLPGDRGTHTSCSMFPSSHYRCHLGKTPSFLPFPFLFSCPPPPLSVCAEVTAGQVLVLLLRLDGHSNSSKQILSISPPVLLLMLHIGQSGTRPFLLHDESLCEQTKQCRASCPEEEEHYILSPAAASLSVYLLKVLTPPTASSVQ